MPVRSPRAAIDRWRSDLARWAIPQEILDAAPEDPWAFPPCVLAARADRASQVTTPTPSHRRALAALVDGGAVLDIGAGAGAASLPLLARASSLIAVDTDAAVLEELRARVPADIDLRLVQGRWPDVAVDLPQVDVVVCNHVVYNIPDLDEAALRMTEKAQRRVVLELSREHPLAWQSFLWSAFHGIERPTRPTAADAIDVIRTCGLAPQSEEWIPDEVPSSAADPAQLVASVRRRLCLGADRDPEIAQLLESRLVRRDGRAGMEPSALVTVWWDVSTA